MFFYQCVFTLFFLTTNSFFSLFTHNLISNEKSIVVVIPSYNNASWYGNNLNSIRDQEYSNYRVIYIDDCSTDSTGQYIYEWLQNSNLDYSVINFDDSFSDEISEITSYFSSLVNQEKHKYILVRNKHRVGALCNLYRAIYSSSDHEIIVTVDGDDWLPHRGVLKEINQVYSSQNVWLTHGKLIEFPNNNFNWCEPIPHHIIANNAFREFKCPSHLRTFYCWLFKKIELEDLLFQGKFFPMTWDMAIMYPMIEMAGNRHAFIYSINYVYNVANQINDNKVNAQLQRDLDHLIRHKRRYERLSDDNQPMNSSNEKEVL